jgi:hypothetical protein
MSKTCETCKWFENKTADYGVCFLEPPPWAYNIVQDCPEVAQSSRCSKWETKLERRCNNCDYAFKLVGEDAYECRRYTRSLVTNACHWCGEFRGKE